MVMRFLHTNGSTKIVLTSQERQGFLSNNQQKIVFPIEYSITLETIQKAIVLGGALKQILAANVFYIFHARLLTID